MRFARDAIITLAILFVVVSLAAYSRLHRGGLSAEAEPGTMERAIATRLARLSIPTDAKRQENPFREDPTVWRTAADHYRDHCALCHGENGRAQTAIGEGLYPKVVDLADPVVQRLSDGELFYVIQNGVRWTGMPAWKREHSTGDTWRLVSFIRKVPTLSHDDLEAAGLTSEADPHEHRHDHERGSEMGTSSKR